MFVLMVYRPDVAGATDGDNPFAGIEILATASDDATISAVIREKTSEHPDWWFHVERVNVEVA